ncbi:MAG: hypothetical protein KDE26_32895, partial [Bacteroidetes bacterium]|nr:hypothetical protein [Bacteroidota bacterium]
GRIEQLWGGLWDWMVNEEIRTINACTVSVYCLFVPPSADRPPQEVGWRPKSGFPEETGLAGIPS